MKFKLSLFSLSIVASLFLFSCKKEMQEYSTSSDEHLQKLFAFDKLNDVDIKSLAKQALEEKDKFNLSQEFKSPAYDILWSKAIKNNSSKGYFAIIPITKDKTLSGFIISKKFETGQFSFDIYKKERLGLYQWDSTIKGMNAYKVQSVLNMLRFTFSGKKSYQVIDWRQVPRPVRKRTNTTNLKNILPRFNISDAPVLTGRMTTSCSSYRIETQWWFCPHGNGAEGHECADDVYKYSTYETVNICIEDGGPGGNGGSVGSGGVIWTGGNGGTGGGGAIPTYDFMQPFNDIYSPYFFDQEQLIDNGIEIEDIDPEEITGIGNIRRIAKTIPRDNTEDLTYGTNGDMTGILPFECGRTNAELFDGMDDLFWFTTFFNHELRAVGDIMIEQFKTNTSTNFVFENSVLNRHVRDNKSFTNFLKKFGNQLATQLSSNNGNISAINEIIIEDRPIFNGGYNKFHGLQILINDTEYTEIQLDNYYLNPTGTWEADVTVTIWDHFGLDRNDALTYQTKHPGFADWWLLQHTRGFVPFKTKVVVKKRIKGVL